MPQSPAASSRSLSAQVPEAAAGKPLIAPSLLSADFSDLRREMETVATAPWLHLDVMDGHFVPNISFGMPVIKALRPHSKAFFDAHLMVSPVDPHLDALAEAGVDQMTVHVEGNWHLNRTLQRIAALGCKVGVALCPATPPEVLGEVLELVDTILVMTVNPGFGGQTFMPGQLPKIRRLAQMIDENEERTGRRILLGVDGGINLQTAPLVTAAGARLLVAGSSVFGQKDRPATIAALQAAACAGEEGGRSVEDVSARSPSMR
ncbi:ribulose-phosphate 3-epimerase [Oecophyllibacter saccharovorans]|uniref:ribulose-phosphate 3-epimerase n=1 Tax=Oecophyllibacter saccharovorans TaxID=2558360 RepID=UPI00116869FC|nr:ribulose-phosphate 3-epimerase [Oecophyllibacter saccharovorans]TPW36254.1 ribulose-phosphate 3-epimerase [Oecophyllibacter saccharovorans]